MYFLHFLCLCGLIGAYLYFQINDLPLPASFGTANTWLSWAFLLLGLFTTGRIVVDCLTLSAKGEMSAENVRNGLLLAVLNFLPTLGMSWFMLREGFVGK